MKITKRRLRRIIREEKARILKESVSDMMDFEVTVDEAAEKISWKFGESMFKLMDEDPEMFRGPGDDEIRSTPEEWEQQVSAAQQEMVERLKVAMNRVVSQVEDRLHGGDFHSGNAPGGRFTK